MVAQAPLHFSHNIGDNALVCVHVGPNVRQHWSGYRVTIKCSPSLVLKNVSEAWIHAIDCDPS